MRVFLFPICLLICSCASQPAPVIADYEQPAPRVSSDWECDPKSAGLWNCSAAREPKAGNSVPQSESSRAQETGGEQAVLAAASDTTESTMKSEASAAVASEGNYVLQVGAFRERESAEKAVKQIDRSELTIVATRRGDEDWFVLLLGAYPDAVEAREAGEAYLNTYPAGAIWVRSAADLTATLRDR